eukprot:1160085-Pelagomonas_calceolata.AAC.2
MMLINHMISWKCGRAAAYMRRACRGRSMLKLQVVTHMYASEQLTKATGYQGTRYTVYNTYKPDTFASNCSSADSLQARLT